MAEVHSPTRFWAWNGRPTFGHLLHHWRWMELFQAVISLTELLVSLQCCVWGGWGFLILDLKQLGFRNFGKNERQECTSCSVSLLALKFLPVLPQNDLKASASGFEHQILHVPFTIPTFVKENVMTCSYHVHNFLSFFYWLFPPSTKTKLDLQRRC